MDPAEDDHLSEQEQVSIAKKMFIGGFIFLPWLWLCNILFFREYMNKQNAPPAVKFCTQRSFESVLYYLDVKASLLGFLVYTSAFLVWLITYLVSRNSWGATGDQISLVIPNGE